MFWSIGATRYSVVVREELANPRLRKSPRDRSAFPMEEMRENGTLSQ